MFVVDDQARLAALTYKMMEVADRFVDRYGDDGGCDEGPAYWNEAGGALLTLLELLHSRTGGAIDVYDRPKIAAIGAFIANAHIAGPWFVSFSDADAQTVPHPGKVYRYGERAGLPALKDLALAATAAWKPGDAGDPPLVMSGVSRAMTGPLMELFWVPAGARPAGGALPATVWMPDIQMLVARESADTGRTRPLPVRARRPQRREPQPQRRRQPRRLPRRAAGHHRRRPRDVHGADVFRPPLRPLVHARQRPQRAGRERRGAEGGTRLPGDRGGVHRQPGGRSGSR